MSQTDWKTLWEMDRDHFIHPYTDFSTFREQGSQIISSAEGVHVIDSQGNRLLDGMAGLWCVNIGHGRREMAECIAEPIMGAGGVLVAPRGYQRKMWEICRENDVLYIADEVVTGFGRLGAWFASEEVYDYVPDVLVLAKGINSGYVPLGAAIFSEAIYDVISQPQCEGGTLTMGFTYSGHPIACAAALKNIEIIEREDICAGVRDVGAYFYEQALTLRDLPMVGDVRGSHFMVGIEYVADKQRKTPFDANVRVAERVFEACRDKGLIVRPIGNQTVLSPPLIMTRAQSDRLFAILRSSIEQTASAI